ncbi:hypothetical protein Tco_1419339 [Tanacetum coccineum]
MNPLAAQLERKPKRYHGTRRGHPSTSSSTFDQLSLSHLDDDDDDDDDGNDEGTSRASTPSPIRYVNSLTNQVPQVFQNPPNIDPHLEPFYTRQTEIINRQVQLRDEQRGGEVDINKKTENSRQNDKNCEHGIERLAKSQAKVESILKSILLICILLPSAGGKSPYVYL